MHRLPAADADARQGMWALVDSNNGLVGPSPRLTNPNRKFYVVQTTSPKPVRWKEWRKQKMAKLVVMAPFSWEEMYIIGYVGDEIFL